jgi:transcriptional regulator with XRE-family HTH domain
MTSPAQAPGRRLDPTLLRIALRARLREARLRAGQTQQQVAATLRWSSSKLIRIEAGQVGLSWTDLQALVRQYAFPDDEADEIFAIAKQSWGKAWYDNYENLLSAGFRQYLGYEWSASHLRQFHPSLIPGLLQVEEYALEVLVDGNGYSAPEAALRWEARKERQKVHELSNPPRMEFVVDEAALRRLVGGEDVMRRQIDALVGFARHPHVTIQIVPFHAGAYLGQMGQFTLVELDSPDLSNYVVHLESQGEATLLDDQSNAGEFLDTFSTLQRRATHPDQLTAALATIQASSLTLSAPSP